MIQSFCMSYSETSIRKMESFIILSCKLLALKLLVASPKKWVCEIILGGCEHHDIHFCTEIRRSVLSLDCKERFIYKMDTTVHSKFVNHGPDYFVIFGSIHIISYTLSNDWSEENAWGLFMMMFWIWWWVVLLL